jgi:hemolysin activation/secretion protein
LFAFADAGWASYKDEEQTFSHTYFGTGLGLNLETKNSQVNLSWAVGKRNDLPFDLRQSKIHIGFVNYF